MKSKLIIAIVIVGILAALGIWQVQRAIWKHNLIATIEARQEMAPAQSLEGDADALKYRRAILTGTINRAATFDLLARTFNGKSGRHILAPMVYPTSNTTGIVVLVDLGWVPDDYRKPDNQGMGIETVSGTLMPPIGRNAFTPPNQPATGKLYSIDIDLMANYLHAPVFPLVLYADALGEAPPIGGQANLTLPDNHTMYAVFWFVMAIVAAVMFTVAMRKDEEKAEIHHDRDRDAA